VALGTPVVAATAYSSNNGASVAPAYPSNIAVDDVVLLFVGQKPSTANGGTVTTPNNWTLREELLAAGGYGNTLGADTGNTNLRVYSWDAPVANQSGTLSVTLSTNNISWAFMVRIPTGGGNISFGSATGQRTTTPTSPMSIALTNGTTATNFASGDLAIWAMCIPTDVTTPNQFSAQAVTASGATFGTAVEMNEPDSQTGNDIGGYSAYAGVTAGSSTTAPTVTTNLAGTLTNVRGPVVLLRVREAALAPITGTLAATEAGSDTLSSDGSVIVSGTADLDETGSDTFSATGTVSDAAITGTLAATEVGSDTLSSSGVVLVRGSVSATEVGSDTASVTGSVLVQGTSNLTEIGSDTFAASGGGLTTGDMAAQEVGSDTASITGGVRVQGSAALTESGKDTTYAWVEPGWVEGGYVQPGTVGKVLVRGSLAVTETGSDTFSANGTELPPIAGNLSATETGSDTAIILGRVVGRPYDQTDWQYWPIVGGGSDEHPTSRKRDDEAQADPLKDQFREIIMADDAEISEFIFCLVSSGVLDGHV